MNFTDEQLKAVEYAESLSAAVSASAGSGKTAVLVEHIARLISDKERVVPADRIVAVTFTEKAAAELRQRLEKRVKELMAANPHDEFFRDQLVRLSNARISTISSFCLGIIRENLRYLPHISEEFTVCDDTKSRQLSAKAMEYTLDRMYKQYSPEQQAEIFAALGGEPEITAKVEQLQNFLFNIPDPEGWIEDGLKTFSDPLLFFRRYIAKGAEMFIGYLKEAEAAEDCLEPYLNDSKAKSAIKKITEILEGLKELEQPLSDLTAIEDWEELRELTSALPVCPDLKAPLNKDSHVKNLVSRMDSCRKLALQIFAGEENREECLAAFRSLLDIQKVYDGELKRLKIKEKVFDFSDLERYALEILSMPECSDYGSGSFDYIIVDEFQDSNDIQYEIFRLLSEKTENLYLVGDVKQSIYGFRNANPDIFAGCLSDPGYNKLYLNSNFRSSDNVINTVNLCFGENMPHEFAKGDKWQDMRPARGIKDCPQNRSELVIINSLSGQENREPMYIARRIQEMIEEGFLIHGKDNTVRKCGYGDFAVLIRNNEGCALYRRLFEEQGIPCVSVGDKAFTDLAEVKIAVAVLETVLHPNDDLAAATAMMSPAYGFTAEEMAQLRLLGRSEENEAHKEKITLYKALSSAEISSSPLKDKAEKFLKDMRLLRKSASDSVTEELIRKIYSVTETDRLMSVGEKGSERRENLRLLLHYAKGCPRAADFLAMIKNISRNKLEMPQAAIKEQAEKSVKIMTIHSSKGLQYPVVFLCGTNGNAAAAPKSLIFDYDKKIGAGISLCDYNKKFVFNTLSRQILTDSRRDRDKGEELRLLYVAMTRAEEKLIITAKAAVKEKDGEIDEEAFPVYRAGNTFSFFYDIYSRKPEAFKLVRIPSSRDVTPLKASETRDGTEIPLNGKIKERLSYRYPYQAAVQTPAKFTATALGVNAEQSGSGEGEDTVSTAFYMGLPLFMKEGKSLTPKERGDVYHKVMEKLNFAAASAESELERLEREKELTPEERRAVDPWEIQAFLDSDTAKRANAAEKIYREFPLFTTINATGEETSHREDLSFIQGVADMFFIEKGEIVLADYKTNRNTTAEKLIKEYKGQLEIYKKALEEMLGLRVKECLLFGFSLKKEIRVEP